MDEKSRLSYAITPRRWYQRRSVQRWLMLAAVAAVLFGLHRMLRPMWDRYRYYKSEQAITATWAPTGIAVRFSTTQPYAHTPGVIENRYASFLAKPTGLPGLVSIKLGSPHAMVFSGVLQTATGRRRLVQVYASPVPQGIALTAVVAELHDGKWVFRGSPSAWPVDDTWFGGLNLSLTHFKNANVCGGTLNPGDPSEIDVKIILNEVRYDIPLHVVELPALTDSRGPRPGGRVAVAAPLDNLFHYFNGSGGWSFYKWPYNGAP